MKATYIIDEFNLNTPKPENAKYVSYSQFSSFMKCEHYWKLCHIDKLKDREDTIHTVFGSAMHTVVQHWLKILYTKSVKESDALDFKEMLFDELRDEYMAAVNRMGRHFSTPDQLSEFFSDGLLTLEFLRKHRKEYFDRKNEVLIGTEVPLLINPDPTKPNVYLMGYLDIVLKNKVTGKYSMPDLKTSKEGWKKWDKDDKIKTAQVVLYKIYFAKQYNIPEDDIEGSYLILKRKLYEDSLYPQKRTQSYVPAQGSISRNAVQKQFQKFLDSCFLPDGSYNTMYEYRALTGKNCFNCRFCEFKDREDLCPTDKRITL